MALTSLRMTHMCKSIEFSVKDAVAALTEAKRECPETSKLHVILSGYQFRSRMEETRRFLAKTPSLVQIEFDKKFFDK